MSKFLQNILIKSANMEIILRFQQDEISFLVVGGAAVAVHGCRDFMDVNDLDLMVDPAIDNARKVVSALVAKGVQVLFSAEDLAKPGMQVPVKSMSVKYYLDILTPERNFLFSDLFERSVSASLNNTQVRVVARSDLIALKEIAVSRLGAELSKHERDLERLKAM